MIEHHGVMTMAHVQYIRIVDVIHLDVWRPQLQMTTVNIFGSFFVNGVEVPMGVYKLTDKTIEVPRDKEIQFVPVTINAHTIKIGDQTVDFELVLTTQEFNVLEAVMALPVHHPFRWGFVVLAAFEAKNYMIR